MKLLCYTWKKINSICVHFIWIWFVERECVCTSAHDCFIMYIFEKNFSSSGWSVCAKNGRELRQNDTQTVDAIMYFAVAWYMIKNSLCVKMYP